MSSLMAINPGADSAFFCVSLSSQIPRFRPFKTSPFTMPRAFCLHSFPIVEQRNKPMRRTQKGTVSVETSSENESSASTASEEPQTSQRIEKAEVVVKPMMPSLVLKFIWMRKNIGLSLDQVIPGHGTIPSSPYFFWPRKDAWEELKATLESKPWILQKKKIILINQATDIINLWQQGRTLS